MALFGKKTKPPQIDQTDLDLQLSKRCPECFVNLPLDAKECFSCHSRVGKIDSHGKAKRKINWISYLLCVLSWAILIAYIKWAFLSK